MTGHEFAIGVKVTERLVASMSVHVDPLLPVSEYCLKLQFANQWAEEVVEHGGVMKLKPGRLAPCSAKIRPPSSARLPKLLAPPPSATVPRWVPAAGRSTSRL